MMETILAPVLGLVGWTLVMWVWMYATRIPAMAKAKMDAGKLKRKGDLDVLPVPVQQIADNYNHLHEQPTLFYAVAITSHLAGAADLLQIQLAWAYVAIRVVHSVLQATINFVPARFAIFVIATGVLAALTVRAMLAVFGWGVS